MNLPGLASLEGQRKRRWNPSDSTDEGSRYRSGTISASSTADISLLLQQGQTQSQIQPQPQLQSQQQPQPSSIRTDPQLPWEVSPGSRSTSFPSIGEPSGLGRLVSVSAPGSQSNRQSEPRRPPSAAISSPSQSISIHDGSEAACDEVSSPAAASFFRTYFSVIHPQYPFLDMKLCSEYYRAWKLCRNTGTLVGWPTFFVRMIFALGSLIESKSDNSPSFKPQNLKSTAQAEQSIMADNTSTPLIRLQAMLMSAMFALHAENTWRIAHISGAIMKFATLHRFHRLKRDVHDPSNSMAIRVWSCAYVLDRAVSSALGIPASLPDMYISSPLCEAVPEPESPAPWLVDCDSSGDTTVQPDLRTFAHICKIRSIQSFFHHMVEKDDIEGNMPLELDTAMLQQLREWEDSEVIARHSIPNSDGYRSPGWLQHIGHLTRLSICFVNKDNVFTSMADTALRAGCESCVSFRSLQKKKQIAQPWLVFRAAVTLWYIVWAREIPVPREVHDALRDCSAVLAIFAESGPRPNNTETVLNTWLLRSHDANRWAIYPQVQNEYCPIMSSDSRRLESTEQHRECCEKFVQNDDAL